MKAIINKNRVAIFYFSVLVFVGGCGSQFTTVRLDPLTAGVDSTFSVDFDSQDIYIENFIDARREAAFNVVGEAKTGMFNNTTPILIEDSLNIYLTDAFRQAFTKAGLHVTNDSAGESIIMQGRINNFWLQEFASGFAPEFCEAQVELDLALFRKHGDKPIWFDVKKNQVKSKSTDMDISAQNEIIINQALSEIIASLMSDSDFRSALTKASEGSADSL